MKRRSTKIQCGLIMCKKVEGELLDINIFNKMNKEVLKKRNDTNFVIRELICHEEGQSTGEYNI